MKTFYAKKRRFAFNMIEIALAMAVITLGIVGVLALLPPSLQNSNDAKNDALACEAAANIMEFVKILHKNGKIPENICKLSDLKTRVIDADDDEDKRWSDDEKKFQNGIPDSETDSTPEPWLKYNDKNVGPELYYPKGKTANKKSIDMPLIYCDENQKPILHARMFYIPTTMAVTSKETRKILTVYVEISWPLRKIYKNREKRMFIMEFPSTE